MPTRPIPALAPLLLALALAWTGQAHAVQGLQSDDTAPIPGRLLVKFKAEADAVAAETGARDQGVSEVRRLRGGDNARTAVARRWRVMGFSSQESLARMMDRVARLPGVESVEPDYPVRATGIPNDSRFSELWGLNNTGQTGGTADADIDAPEAWDILAGGAVLVAVVDTGVDYTHPDLAANIWTNPGEIAGNGIDDDGNGYVDDVHGYNFVYDIGAPDDEYGHGTHCAGTIGAVGDNGLGVVGVCWNVRLMALKFLDAWGWGTSADAVRAIEYGVRMGARVLSGSWGGLPESAALRDAIEVAGLHDVLYVAAAGNYASDNDAWPVFPASYDLDNVVAVAATDRHDELASFSCWGAASVDLAAPGVEVLSTVPGDHYPDDVLPASGTSMAAPIVAGVGALAFQAHPEWTNDQFKWLLQHTSAQLGAGQLPGQGAGEVDAAALPGFGATPGLANQNQQISEMLIGPDGATIYVGQASANWSSANWSSANWSSANWSSANWSSANWSTANWTAAPELYVE